MKLFLTLQGGNISTHVLVHVLRFVCRVRTVRAREAAVPGTHFLAHVCKGDVCKKLGSQAQQVPKRA